MPLVRKPPSETPPAAAPAPGTALRSGSAEQRWEAARTLGGDPGGVAILAGALAEERDPRVREAIFTSLARIGGRAGAEAVLPWLRSDEASLRVGALDALSAMGEAVSPYLEALLADADADVRLLACELARQLPPREATERLCRLLELETEANVCASAVEALAEVGGPEALPVLARCSERFSGEPFLVFSIKAASDRIGAGGAGGRG